MGRNSGSYKNYLQLECICEQMDVVLRSNSQYSWLVLQDRKLVVNVYLCFLINPHKSSKVQSKL